MTDESHAATVTLRDAMQGPHPACYSRLVERKLAVLMPRLQIMTLIIPVSSMGPFEAHSDDALNALAKEMEGNGGEMTRKELRLESFTSAILLPTTLPASDAAQNEEPLPSLTERRTRRKHQHHRRPPQSRKPASPAPSRDSGEDRRIRAGLRSRHQPTVTAGRAHAGNVNRSTDRRSD